MVGWILGLFWKYSLQSSFLSLFSLDLSRLCPPVSAAHHRSCPIVMLTTRKVSNSGHLMKDKFAATVTLVTRCTYPRPRNWFSQTAYTPGVTKRDESSFATFNLISLCGWQGLTLDLVLFFLRVLCQFISGSTFDPRASLSTSPEFPRSHRAERESNFSVPSLSSLSTQSNPVINPVGPFIFLPPCLSAETQFPVGRYSQAPKKKPFHHPKKK